MELTSPVFEEGGEIPAKFTCDGENVSPELVISGAPEGAKSLVLIMEDPDVPPQVREDRMWNHWVAFNIPPETETIPENTQPEGTKGVNTSRGLGYGGPCPPDREHRYFFKLFALDTLLELEEGATKEQVLEAMSGHVLAEAQLMGMYNRKR